MCLNNFDELDQTFTTCFNLCLSRTAMELSGGGWRVMSFQLNYCIMLFVVVSSPALLHCTANVNLTNTRCALDYLRLDSPYCAVLSQTNTRKLFTFFHSKSQRFVQVPRLIRRQKFVCIDGRRNHCGCKVDGTCFTNVAFIKTNDNILPRSSTSAGMNDNMTISRP